MRVAGIFVARVSPRCDFDSRAAGARVDVPTFLELD